MPDPSTKHFNFKKLVTARHVMGVKISVSEFNVNMLREILLRTFEIQCQKLKHLPDEFA